MQIDEENFEWLWQITRLLGLGEFNVLEEYMAVTDAGPNRKQIRRYFSCLYTNSGRRFCNEARPIDTYEGRARSHADKVNMNLSQYIRHEKKNQNLNNSEWKNVFQKGDWCPAIHPKHPFRRLYEMREEFDNIFRH